MKKPKHELSATEINTLRKFYRVLSQFHDMSKRFPVSYMEGLLHIAFKQGLGTKELSERMGVGKDDASRILGAIGHRARRDADAFGLVEQETDLYDSRMTHYYLTPKGFHLLKRIAADLE